jgi:hypothetical protein
MKHKVAGFEGPSAYLSAVVVAEALLIDYRSGEGYISHFVQQIVSIFKRWVRSTAHP